MDINPYQSPDLERKENPHWLANLAGVFWIVTLLLSFVLVPSTPTDEHGNFMPLNENEVEPWQIVWQYVVYGAVFTSAVATVLALLKIVKASDDDH